MRKDTDSVLLAEIERSGMACATPTIARRIAGDEEALEQNLRSAYHALGQLLERVHGNPSPYQPDAQFPAYDAVTRFAGTAGYSGTIRSDLEKALAIACRLSAMLENGLVCSTEGVRVAEAAVTA